MPPLQPPPFAAHGEHVREWGARPWPEHWQRPHTDPAPTPHLPSRAAHARAQPSSRTVWEFGQTLAALGLPLQDHAGRSHALGAPGGRRPVLLSPPADPRQPRACPRLHGSATTRHDPCADWLLSRGNRRFRFLPVFSRLRSSIPFSDAPASGWTAVHPHEAQGTAAAGQSGQLSHSPGPTRLPWKSAPCSPARVSACEQDCGRACQHHVASDRRRRGVFPRAVLRRAPTRKE